MIRYENKNRILDMHNHIKTYDGLDIEKAERERTVNNWKEINKSNGYCEFWEHSYVCGYMFCEKIRDIGKNLFEKSNNYKLIFCFPYGFSKDYPSCTFTQLKNIYKIRLPINKFITCKTTFYKITNIKLFQNENYYNNFSSLKSTNPRFINDNNAKLIRAILEETLTIIPPMLFYSHTFLRRIEISNSITKIGYSAFSDCHCLNKINIPDTVTYISSFAFDSCYKLRKIYIPKSCTICNFGCFQSCTNLTVYFEAQKMTNNQIGLPLIGIKKHNGMSPVTNMKNQNKM